MPVTLRLTLSGPPPRDAFQHMEGLRARLLAGWRCPTDPARRERLHDANQRRPFAVGPIWPGPAPGLWTFDLSLLWDDLADEAAACFAAPVRLGAQRYALAAPPSVVTTLPWVDLLEMPAPAAPRWTVRLLSPTAHHAPGRFRKVVWLPTPEAYFGSWLGQWNRCAPQRLDDSLLDAVAAQVAVADLQGGQARASIESGCPPFRGFVGTVIFEALRPSLLPTGALEALNALARLSEFCGTGVETGRGMGQTRLVPAV